MSFPLTSMLQIGGAGSAGWMNILLMVSIVVVFYLFMIRPQTKKQKEEKKMRESLKKGDKVVTIGGVHAKVLSVEDLTVLLEVDEGVKVRFDKAAVRNVVDSDKNG
ncbi:MAG: preprotein translocase subunit YajC [Sphingobacteriia bacterium]|nr:preprotein translocase subunit YajC [Sphingobacteriia bacterium]